MATQGQCRAKDETEPHNQHFRKWNHSMTPDQFVAWLDSIRASGRVSRKRWQIDAAGLIGVKPATIRNYMRDGCGRTVALACAAVVAGLEPYA